MKTDNIEKLKTIEKRRESKTGYMINKEKVYISVKKSIDLTIAGSYDNRQFDRYMRLAILEKEKELLQRAFELEEQDYQETKRLAKIEAANILAGQELI